MGEPLNNPRLAILNSYPNVIVTPHTAFYTDEAVSNMVENSILNIIDFFSQYDILYNVNFASVV